MKRIIKIISMIHLITIFRIIVYIKADSRAQSKALDPLSVVAVAENKRNTQTYQTVSGDTSNAPLSMPGGLIETRSIR